MIDFHCHTSYSYDGYVSVRDMAEAAFDAGIRYLCITDHIDVVLCTSVGKLAPNCFDFYSQEREDFLRAKEEYRGRLEMFLGIELSEACQYPDFARGITDTDSLDFIIGSIHQIRGENDFYIHTYESLEQCVRLYSQYLDEYLETADTGCFDVLGHIGYPLRYMKRKGFTVDTAAFDDKYEAIFKMVIAAGKGIELNTSGLRDAIDQTIPSFAYLKMYRELGGEIITLGSDSHKTELIGADTEYGLELLREAGFDYVTLFRQRKPVFLKL